jgi:glycosyltransferase involved in cell wall biosynthesis
MVDEKNVALLIPIFAAIAAQDHELELVLIGDGPQASTVRHAAAELDESVGNRIRLIGPLNEPLPMIAEASLMLLPSHSEGLPMVLLEALALGVPIIAADCSSGGVHSALGGATPHNPDRTAVEETSCGVLLPVPRGVSDDERIALWAQTVTALLADPSRLQRLAEGALVRANNYRPEAAAQRWNAVIDEVLSR